MEGELKVKRQQIIFYVFAGIFFSTGTAIANNPPSGQTFLSMISILPLMIIFSMIGGAYEVLKRLKPKKLSKVLRISGIAVAILFSMAHEGFAVLVTFIFGIIAIVRGFRMLGWGLGAMARDEKPAHLTAARPWRLISCSVSLIVFTLFLAGFSVVFLSPLHNEYKYHEMERAIKKFVIHQISYTHKHKTATGQSRFDEGAQDKYFKAFPNTRVEYSPDGNHFTVVMPPDFLPIFPYNYLTAVPSYRADETGQIRMIRVKKKDQLCPIDAPVIMRIEVQDLEKEMRSSS
ncbi:MAG: hypothetical protein PVG96_09020 [Desulfobacterales bacterium]|jgi:hypothetical protein